MYRHLANAYYTRKGSGGYPLPWVSSLFDIATVAHSLRFQGKPKSHSAGLFPSCRLTAGSGNWARISLLVSGTVM